MMVFSEFFARESTNMRLLVLQCDGGRRNDALMASARYIISKAHREALGAEECNRHVVMIVQLQRKPGGCFKGFEVCIDSFNVPSLIYIAVFQITARRL